MERFLNQCVCVHVCAYVCAHVCVCKLVWCIIFLQNILGGHDSIVKKVMKNYQPLSTLNADALLMDLYARDVITTEEKEIIETTIPLRSKKMQFIIDKVIIPSLKVGTTMKFKNFLEAMEASEDLTIKEVGSRLGMLNFSHKRSYIMY